MAALGWLLNLDFAGSSTVAADTPVVLIFRAQEEDREFEAVIEDRLFKASEEKVVV